MASPAINLLQLLMTTQSSVVTEDPRGAEITSGEFQALMGQMANGKGPAMSIHPMPFTVDPNAAPTAALIKIIPPQPVTPPQLGGSDDLRMHTPPIFTLPIQHPESVNPQSDADNSEPAGSIADVSDASDASNNPDMLAMLMVPVLPVAPPVSPTAGSFELSQGTVAQPLPDDLATSTLVAAPPMMPRPMPVQTAPVASPIQEAPSSQAETNAEALAAKSALAAAERDADFGKTDEDHALLKIPGFLNDTSSSKDRPVEAASRPAKPSVKSARRDSDALQALQRPSAPVQAFDAHEAADAQAAQQAKLTAESIADTHAANHANTASLAPVSGSAAPAITSDRQPLPPQRAPFMAHPPVLEQVTMQVHRALGNGESHIKVNLQPAELGRVDIRMDTASDGKTSVTVSADRQDTLNLMQRDSRTLERILHESGIQTDANSLSFNLRQQNGQGGQDQQFAGAQTYRFGVPVEDAAGDVTPEPLPVLKLSDRQLDISI